MINVYINPDYPNPDGWVENVVEQTPQERGIWEDVRLVDEIEMADYQIAMKSVREHVDGVRTLLFTREPPCILPEARWQNVDVYRKFPLSKIHLPQLWWIDKTYDELKALEPVSKSKDLSWVTSNKGQSTNPPWFRLFEWYRRLLIEREQGKYEYKCFPGFEGLIGQETPFSDVIFKVNNGFLNFPTDGHIVRMDFLKRLGEEFPDLLDLYGYGTWDPTLPYYEGELDDKWDGLASYRYSLAINNYRGDNYWGKVTEPLLAWCMPITWGCTNLSNFIPEESFVEIDIEDERAPRRVREVVNSDRREQNIDAIAEARRRILDEYQFWPTVKRVIDCVEGDQDDYQLLYK